MKIAYLENNTLIITVFQHAPTNKLLYARDIPKFKQEVKIYYKQIREQTSITVSEFKAFLQEESKVSQGVLCQCEIWKLHRCEDQQRMDEYLLSFQKHENEFNEAVALRELYKFINRYFTEVSSLYPDPPSEGFSSYVLT